MFGQPENNPNELRVVKTARTAEAINAAAMEGFRPLVKPVEPSPEIHNCVSVYQHRETGVVEVSGDCRWRPGEDYDQVLFLRYYYPYSFPEPFAAYLLPSDLTNGERVWLEDIIEDIVAVFGNQGWCPRLESCEATWKDGDFIIHFDPEKDAPRLIG
jgi:hypothetical protein